MTEEPRPWMENDVDRLARELHEKGEQNIKLSDFNIDDISTETWQQRANRRWKDLGGPGISTSPPWKPSDPQREKDLRSQELAAEARAYADHFMLDEIHAMLRFLVRKLT